MEAADRLPLVPPFHGFRPLLGNVVLPKCLQSTHQFAIDHARRERIDLSRDRRHGGFIQQFKAPSDIALQD
jgi:hypothetical protein